MKYHLEDYETKEDKLSVLPEIPALAEYLKPVMVPLPKVREEIRDQLRMMKARRKDKGLSETLDYLIGLEDRIKELGKGE
jgi:hypothetical protein